MNVNDITKRHEIEAALDALYHRAQVLARAEPSLHDEEARNLQTLAARIRATLDRSPETWAAIQASQGNASGGMSDPARFPLAEGEAK